MSSCLEVEGADGRRESFPLGDEPNVLGRSAHLRISLPHQRDLDLEHALFLSRGAAGCWVALAQRASTPLWLNGEEFRSGLVPWGSELRLGSVRVRPLRDGSPRRGRLPSVVVVLASLVIGAGSFLWFGSAQSEGSVSQSNGRAPLLWPAGPSCPRDLDPMAAAEAAELASTYRATRYPYDPQDGVRAVRRLEEAEACYMEALQPAGAARARVASEALRAGIDADYASLRYQIEEAVETSRWRDVVTIARRLRRLIAHLEDQEYGQWLERAERQADAKL